MEVLHIINSLEVGGAQKLLADILPLMKCKGVNVSLLVLKSVDTPFNFQIKNSGVRIFSLDNKSYYNPLTFLKLIPFLKKFKIIHAHLFPTLYWVALARVFSASPTLFFTEHNTNNRRRNKRYLSLIERLIYSKYHKIISISSQTECNLKRWLGVNSLDSKFIQINNGVNLADFMRRKGNKSEIYNIPQSVRVVLMISRFTAQKDQETVIRAIQYISINNILFAFAGSGPTIEKCKQLAHELGVSEKIVFLGQRTDIPELINASYIGIQSSFWEGFGLTAVEFMAGNRPIIASDVPGLKQVVEDAGLLFPVGDEFVLAKYIIDLLSDRQYYTQVSERCLSRAEQYDIHIMVERYIEEYRKVLN